MAEGGAKKVLRFCKSQKASGLEGSGKTAFRLSGENAPAYAEGMKRNDVPVRTPGSTGPAMNPTLLLTMMICNVLTFVFVTTLGVGILISKGSNAPTGAKVVIVLLIIGSGFYARSWIRKYMRARKVAGRR